MKLLLDECLPRKLKAQLGGHECMTVPEAGLAGKKNGELLALAEQKGFEVFLTLDRGIEYQQNLTARKLAVFLVQSKSSRLQDVLHCVPQILQKLQSAQGGELTHVGG